jgi:hypothetical protein
VTRAARPVKSNGFGAVRTAGDAIGDRDRPMTLTQEAQTARIAP